MNPNCIFCKIASHESESKIELENESIIAFNSISPAAEVHILIVPKKHIESFEDMAQDEMNVLPEMAKAAQKLIEMKNIQKGYKLVFNGGQYQSVKHMHWHLLGGKFEDENDAINKT